MTTATIQTATIQTAGGRRATRRAFRFVNPFRVLRERQAELDGEIKRSQEELAELAESRAMLVGALEKLESKASERVQ